MPWLSPHLSFPDFDFRWKRNWFYYYFYDFHSFQHLSLFWKFSSLGSSVPFLLSNYFQMFRLLMFSVTAPSRFNLCWRWHIKHVVKDLAFFLSSVCLGFNWIKCRPRSHRWPFIKYILFPILLLTAPSCQIPLPFLYSLKWTLFPNSKYLVECSVFPLYVIFPFGEFFEDGFYLSNEYLLCKQLIPISIRTERYFVHL